MGDPVIKGEGWVGIRLTGLNCHIFVPVPSGPGFQASYVVVFVCVQ